MLAARGAQNAATTIVGLLIAALGVLPLAMIFSPAGPQGTSAVLVTIAVALTIFLNSAMWLRRRWPTRKQSLVLVALTTPMIAAAALVQSNPVGGLAATAVFGAVAGYLVFFHAARYLGPVVVVGTATALVPFLRIVHSGDTVLACCLLASIVFISLTAVLVSHAFVYLLGITAPDRDIEPLTGLLNRDAFYESTGALIASRSRLDDRHLVIVVVNLDHFGLLTGSGGVAAGERARVAVSRAVRETTRHDALVAHVAESEFLVADSFGSPDSSALVERIRSAIRSTPLRMTASMGVVSTPMADLASSPPYELLDELIALGTTAMYEARRAGGNRAHYVVCDRPTAIEDYPDRTEDAC